MFESRIYSSSRVAISSSDGNRVHRNLLFSRAIVTISKNEKELYSRSHSHNRNIFPKNLFIDFFSIVCAVRMHHRQSKLAVNNSSRLHIDH